MLPIIGPSFLRAVFLCMPNKCVRVVGNSQVGGYCTSNQTPITSAGAAQGFGPFALGFQWQQIYPQGSNVNISYRSLESYHVHVLWNDSFKIDYNIGLPSRPYLLMFSSKR
jgi:hypothetical protein